MKQNTEYVCKDSGNRITPKYTHHCHCCIFLGHFNNNDLYICNHSRYIGVAEELRPVIARYNNGSGDYTTMPYKYALKNLQIDQPLFVAAVRYNEM